MIFLPSCIVPHQLLLVAVSILFLVSPFCRAAIDLPEERSRVIPTYKRVHPFWSWRQDSTCVDRLDEVVEGLVLKIEDPSRVDPESGRSRDEFLPQNILPFLQFCFESDSETTKCILDKLISHIKEGQSNRMILPDDLLLNRLVPLLLKHDIHPRDIMYLFLNTPGPRPALTKAEAFCETWDSLSASDKDRSIESYLIYLHHLSSIPFFPIPFSSFDSDLDDFIRFLSS